MSDNNIYRHIKLCFSSIIGKELWGFTAGKKNGRAVLSCICFENKLHPCIEVAQYNEFYFDGKIYNMNDNVSFYRTTHDIIKDIQINVNDTSHDCDEIAYANHYEVYLRVSTCRNIYDIRTCYPINHYPYIGNHFISDHTSMIKE